MEFWSVKGILYWVKTYLVMNRILIILVFISLIGCKDSRDSHNINTGLEKAASSNFLIYDDTNTKTLYLDTIKSVVNWKGTKLMYTSKHEGTVRFKEGQMVFSNGNIISGQFVVDMQSIYNTDIPKSDPVPRKNLTNHLNKDFEIKLFPTASFIITNVEKVNFELYNISGDMTIKGVSRSIAITMKENKKEKEYSSEFSINRSLWGIGDKGSWLEKKLVDDDFVLKIHIVL